MSILERLRLLFEGEPQTTGFVEDLERDNDPRNLRYDDIAPLGGLVPESGDVEIGNWTLNQGKIPACTCHSTAYAINQVTGWQLSPRYAWHKIKTDPKYPSSRLGWGAFLVDSLKLMQNEGICEYSLLPNIEMQSDEAYLNLPNLGTAVESSANKHKGGSYVYITTGAKTIDERFDDVVRYMAEQKQPVKVGMSWSKSFNNARKGGVVLPVAPSGSSSGHDMLAVAWKRINGHEYIGFRNSFGETWGDKGRIWIPKGVLKISSAIAYLPPAKTKELEVVVPVPVEAPRNSHKEKANAQELQAMIDLKFPLNVDEKNKQFNKNAIVLKGQMWLVFVQAVSYRGWTFTDVVNFLYARSRNKTTNKAYNLDFTKQKYV